MKKLLCMLLIMLLLTGCSFRTATYSSATQPEKINTDIRFETISIPMLYDVTIEYADGKTEEIHYVYGEGRTYAYGEHWLDRRPLSATFEENGEEVGTEEYIRDEQGNITAIIPDGDESRAQHFELTCDENGNIIQRLIFGGAGDADKEIYTYDDADRVCELSEYKGETLLRRTVTEYTDEGTEKSVTVYDGSGAVMLRKEYIPDESGYKDTVLEYDGSGNLLRRIERGYNYEKIVVTEEFYDPQDEWLYSVYSRYVSSTYTYMVTE